MRRRRERTCYRAYVGETWRVGKRQREVGEVGEEDEDGGVRGDEQRPFAGQRGQPARHTTITNQRAEMNGQKKIQDGGPRARHLPVWIPSDTERDDVFVREESPEEVQAEEEISRRPRDEAVELWGAAADFRRG